MREGDLRSLVRNIRVVIALVSGNLSHTARNLSRVKRSSMNEHHGTGRSKAEGCLWPLQALGERLEWT